MVIQNTEGPAEMSILRSSSSEAKKYIIVKNHVRELPAEVPKDMSHNLALEKTVESGNSRVRTKRSKKNKMLQPEVTSSKCEVNEAIKEDLEELRTLYRKCKSVMKRIESKYGHLINLEDDDSNLGDQEEDCQCKANTKIVFDDDGQQVLQEPVLENHVCSKKLKRQHSNYSKSDIDQNLRVEFEEENPLPEDFKTLTKILQDEDIDLTYRNKVINKLKGKRFEYQNEIRFSRQGMVEKLKADPLNTDIFVFNGANLHTIVGYPDGKSNK